MWSKLKVHLTIHPYLSWSQPLHDIFFIAYKLSCPDKLKKLHNIHSKRMILRWFDLVWFGLVWFGLIWTCQEIVNDWSEVKIRVTPHRWSLVSNRVVMQTYFLTHTLNCICAYTTVPQKIFSTSSTHNLNLDSKYNRRVIWSKHWQRNGKLIVITKRIQSYKTKMPYLARSLHQISMVFGTALLPS